jgi:rod shape-determining protein MreB
MTLGRDLAIDLGTANTLVYQRGRGVVLDEPSVVAIEAATGKLIAAGTRAKEMLGRTPGHVRAVRPLADGVISDADVTEQMLRYFVDQVRPSRLIRPRMVVCVPSEVTGVERRALEDAAVRSGARRVYVIEEPMAAAIGADLPVNETSASMVVDIGGGTTDVAVISLGGIVTARSVRVGGDEIDEAVIAHVKSEYSLLLGERSAEDIKVAVGSAFPLSEETTTRVRGRDLVSGLPKTVTISSQEVRRAIEGPVLQIVELVRATLDVCPPELAGDILDNGVTLTGGGALLRGLDERLRHELGVPVRVADDPLRAVVRGSGRCIEEFSTLERVLIDTRRY